jgi:hypothetical protein
MGVYFLCILMARPRKGKLQTHKEDAYLAIIFISQILCPE